MAVTCESSMTASEIRWTLEPAQVSMPPPVDDSVEASVVKAIVCRAIAALPCTCWSTVSAIVRHLCPGFGSA
jgi:hypothetical protein